MALSYVEIIGLMYPSVQVECPGDPYVYSNVILASGGPLPSKTQLDADISGYEAPSSAGALNGYTWISATANNLSWLSPLGLISTNSGHIMPLKGTVVGFAAQCGNTNNNTGDINLFINNVDKGSIVTFSGSGEKTSTTMTLNIDFVVRDKLRLRVQGLGPSKTLNNVLVNVYVKWRI